MNATSGKFRYWAPAVVWAGLIFLASSFPSPEGIDLWEHQDKVLHTGVFGMLAFLLFRAFYFQQKISFLKAAPWAILLTALYGALDEGHQYFVPSRKVEFLDWAADASGGLLCVLWLKWMSATGHLNFFGPPTDSRQGNGR